MKRVLKLLLHLTWTSLVILSCSGTGEDLAGKGTGSETPNTLTGIIKTSEGMSAQGVVVTLVENDFNPVDDPVPDSMRAITGSDGSYQIIIGVEGVYNILALHPETNSEALVRDIEIPGGHDSVILAPDGILEQPGSLVIHIRELNLEEGATLIVPGTRINTRVTGTHLEESIIILTNVPPSVYDNITYYTSIEASDINLLASSLLVEPEGSGILGPYSSWNDTARLIFNPVESGIPSDILLTGYPVLLRLNDSEPALSRVFDNAQPGGTDLRFTGSDGITILSHEIEDWDISLRTATVWVLFDSIHTRGAAREILLYSGKEEAVNRSNPVGVFDAGSGYKAVWHLAADETGSSIFNSADPTNHGLFVDTMNTGINIIQSLISPGIRLNGLNQFITSPRIFTPSNLFAVSLWFKTGTTSGGKLIGYTQYPEGVHLDRQIWMDNEGKLHFGLFPEKPEVLTPEDSAAGFLNYGIFRILGTDSAYNDNTWHQVTATLSGSGQRMYVDGILVAEDADVNTAQIFSGHWQIGFGRENLWRPFPTTQYFEGSIDEVRVEYRDVSGDEVKFNYEMMREGSSVVSVQED